MKVYPGIPLGNKPFDNRSSILKDDLVVQLRSGDRLSLAATYFSIFGYAKLPRSFQIPTPVGNYAPDWAIAFKKDSVRHIFFIAETKGSLDALSPRDIENGKIACARRLFNEFSDDGVRYDVVHSYQDMLDIIQVME
ncbi:hypothetical protein [Caniella muris]|uniref:restriction endonuclease n=1 Tax=Caniella muris TaxID=2941502 RepID=UPI00203D8E7E|nr:hypothetical protein [Caniella muris]